MIDEPRYKPKPMTLYVSQNGISEVTLEHIGEAAERILDIELTEQDAIQLRNILSRKLNTEVFGSITFRLKGRLVI